MMAAAARVETLRVAPHSIEAEQAVLGGLMLDNAALPDVTAQLLEGDFYRQDHRLIFQAMRQLAADGKPFDAVTLSERLQAGGDLEHAGGLAYLATMARDTPTAANVRAYAGIVRERAALRQALRVGTELVEAVHQHGSRTASEIVTAAVGRLSPLADPEAARRSKLAITVPLSDIESQPLKWLWPGRLPLGKVSMFSGDPGLGKSLVTLAIAAAVSRGAPWPCGEGRAPQGDVVLVSAEDDAADTIRPRLEAAGADLTKVHVLDHIEERTAAGELVHRPWTFLDLDALDARLAALPDCRLVVVDPLSAYLAGTKSHENADVRQLLAPLAAVAGRHGINILCVSHLNKSGGPAMYRTTGSVAFVAAARTAYAVAKDQDDPGRRLVLPIKSNLSADSSGLAYRVGVVDGLPVVQWEADSITVTADQALAAMHEDAGDRSERQEAADWLQGYLESGPRSAKEVRAAAGAAGLAWATVRRAKDTLGIHPAKTRFDGGWEWALPESKMLKPGEDAQGKSLSTFGEGEHLGKVEGEI